MAQKIVCNAEDLTAIADAVRASNGSTNTYNVPELSAAAVKAIGIGGAAIVDVVAFPETDIDRSIYYRLLKAQVYYNGTPQHQMKCHVVQTLPEVGEPVTTNMIDITLYYEIDSAAVFGYVPTEIGSMIGAPAGWYPVAVLAAAFGLTWGGVVWDVPDGDLDDTNRLLLHYSIYAYTDRWVDITAKIGWESKAPGAEIFNSLTNKADGTTSHAEGFSTTASGNSSHAEGYTTEASGDKSHAEGLHAIANGEASHAEGHSTTASGDYSHAEGSNTTASGKASHAEGLLTIAQSKSQHVEGEFNIIDIASTDERGKYLHIAGNGTHNENRSNAHTLDWEGNGWFAGEVYIGGAGQDDENAVKLLSENDMQRIVEQTIAALPVYGGETE